MARRNARARAHVDRADPQRGQHQPDRLRRLPRRRSPAPVFALFVIAIAAAEVGVGLAIVLLIYRNRRSVDLDEVDRDEGLRPPDGWFLEHAYIIPLIPAASFFLILFFGKRLPTRAPRSASPPSASASCWRSPPTSSGASTSTTPSTRPSHARGGDGDGEPARRRRRRRRGRRPRTGEAAAEAARRTREFDGRARHEVVDVVVERRASTFTVGMLARRARRDDAVRRHADLAARARLQHRLRRRRPALHPLLRLPVACSPRRCSALVMSREHPPAPHLLGAGGPVLVRAHRALVGGEAELRRRPQGLHHQPRGRRRPDLSA